MATLHARESAGSPETCPSPRPALFWGRVPDPRLGATATRGPLASQRSLAFWLALGKTARAKAGSAPAFASTDLVAVADYWTRIHSAGKPSPTAPLNGVKKSPDCTTVACPLPPLASGPLAFE